MSKTKKLKASHDTILEIHNISAGVFHPLKGFMDSADYKSVVENMRLDNGSPWTIPVTLDIPEDKAGDFLKAERILIENSDGDEIAEMLVEDVYKVNYANDIKKVYGTSDKAHAGVAKEMSRSPYRVGGPIKLIRHERKFFPQYAFLPDETKKIFKSKGWKTIVGFQTRNPIHRAHEYLQRIAMEIADGIFIQPLIGWKKADDFSPIAIIKSYERMIEEFYPKEKAVLGVLTTPMRYAGPREAVFHAIVRRNYGCTHFIVGRDHAGVGNYYGKYDAHDLCAKFDDLGIQILRLHGPYYCRRCGCIVTEKTCPHGEKYATSISGTHVRSLFSSGKRPSDEYMRSEISETLLALAKEGKLFCGGK